MYRYFFKRCIDIVLALFFLLISLPVFLIISVLVYSFLGRPIFFRQLRPGLYARPFELIKFRTMLIACDQQGQMLSDQQRLTKFGSFLRRTSLDELPELWNVLKGDMSFVGPRPLLLEYLPLYNIRERRRHEVRPGITGWAQINGRNNISWQEKFKLDVWYVDHLNILLDLKIFIMTFIKVYRRENINAEAHVTMPKFTGTSDE
jgi:lipopolysaccharide/colanic/teichoic acid biosynthesis glycosyltransferase